MTRNYEKLLQEAVNGAIRFNVALSDLTTYKIGGPAQMLLETTDANDIVAAVRMCVRHKIPLTVLGAGSNVLAPDKGIKGLVLRIYSEQLLPSLRGDFIESNAAVTDENLALFASEQNISGFEFIYDVPGTIGGAIMQNVGTNDHQIKDFLIDATYIDKKCEIVTRPVSELGMGYRTSLLKEEWGLILSARFKRGPSEESEIIRVRMEEIRKIRRSKFPVEFPNCGSVFKRPPGDYAGRLIQEAGLGGFSVGNAMVSPRHRGFIVNMGGAGAEEGKAVAAHVQTVVKEKFGVHLERELIFLSERPEPPPNL